MASTTSTASDLGRPLRRSTRLNQAVPVTVMGVDSYRGPYREEVSTVTISCHGCRYESKHDVLTNSWVMLEIPAKKPDAPPVTARGLVKWVQRSAEINGLHQTAIELEDPGNIWGIDAPPPDWFAHSGPKDASAKPLKPKPFAVRKPASPPPVAEHKAVPVPSLPASDRPLGQLMGDFQRHVEQTMLEAAHSVVREQTKSALAEVRAAMQAEAKQVLADAAANNAGAWMSEFVKQMKQASQESARGLHAEWTKRVSADLQVAIDKLAEQKRALDQHAQGLATNAIDRVEKSLETTRKEAVTRIVARLREQVAPVLDDAKKTTADLSKNREEAETMLRQVLDRSFARMEEACGRFEKQFETALQSRLTAAREELTRASQEATTLALNNVQVIIQHKESEARTRFQAALEPIAANALIDLKERATETSRQFSDELADYGRSYLEFVGSSVSDLAKGFGKKSKE